MNRTAAIVSVHWGNEVDIALRLTPKDWKKIQSGMPLQIRGKGYHYEGELF